MRSIIALVLVVLMSTLVIFLIQVYPLDKSPWAALSVSMLVNVITTPLYAVLVELCYNARRIPLRCKTLWYWNDEVRLSIAYLFRIQVNGKYLLLKNRKRDYYQLVGGAYKAFDSAQETFKKYRVSPDRQFTTSHGIAKSDLRFMVPGRYVLHMLDWFYSQRQRETSQWREFCEELLTTSILDKHLFRYVDYTYAGTVQTPMRRAKRLPNQEILVFEIYDLLPTTEQQAALQQLYEEGDTTQLKWASRNLIQTLGTDHEREVTAYEIGAHTKWAVNGEWSDD